MDELTDQNQSMSSGASGGRARMGKLSKEERSKLAKAGAEKRWSASRKKAEDAPISPTQKNRKRRSKKKIGPIKPFGDASVYAQKRLAEAIQERAVCMAQLAHLEAEIPSLVGVIKALGGTLDSKMILPSAVTPRGREYTLAQIISDEPLQQVTPHAPVRIPEPVVTTPVHTGAMGGAIGVELGDDPDEDTFLKDSPMGGGNWHEG